MVWFIALFLPFTRILVDNPSNVANLWFSLTFMFFVVPLTVVSLCYFWSFKAARKQSRTIKRGNHIKSSVNNKAHAIQNYKAIKTIGVVLDVLIVSWMPSLFVSFVGSLTPINNRCVKLKLYFVAWSWIEAIAFTSSAINPWIYCFRNAEFREALHRSFHWFPLDVTPEFDL